MGTKSNKFTQKLKFYHIVLISIILCPFLIFNSNSINKKREEAKLEKEKNIFMRKLYARKLGEDDKFIEDTNKVCEKASKDLRDYYSGKGDLNSIGVDDNNVERKDKNKYIDGLISTVSGEGEGDLMDYVMHLIPLLSFLGFAILFLPGWLVCCICACAGCCCCRCCQKQSCKKPFYIITSLFYAFGLGVSIYGLSQSTAVFEGLGDTECSLMKFINDVLYGESEGMIPRWGGIVNIKNLLRDTSVSINGLHTDIQTLSDNKDLVKQEKEEFEDALQKYSKNIYDDDNTGETDYKPYKHSLTISSESGEYVLDIVSKFGLFTRSSTAGNPPTITENSFVDGWYKEYEQISSKSESQMENAKNDFQQINAYKTDATNAINSGISNIDKFKKAFDKVKKKISGPIVDYSDMIDKYGNIGYKAVFSIFFVLNSLIATFISLRMFCKVPFFQNGSCLIKSLIHILWNILALMTFLILLLGSVLSLVGTAGRDLVSVVSFLVSNENLNRNSNDVILLGDAAEYLVKCINDDGNLKDKLNMHVDPLESLDQLKKASAIIDDLIQKTNLLKETKYSYNNYKKEYDKIKSYQLDNSKLIKTDGSRTLKFRDYYSEANNELHSSYSEYWSLSCNVPHNCEPIGSSHASDYCIDIKTCQTKSIQDWHSSETLSENIAVLNAFIESINTATKEIHINTSPEVNTKSIDYALQILENKYNNYIDKQSSILEDFKDEIDALTNIFIPYTGEEGGFFDVINCLFIGRNVRIILKSLDKSLGKNIYNLGITMLATGLGMCFSISFTILLNIILNLKDNGNGLEDLKMNRKVNIANQYNNMIQGNINSGNVFTNENVENLNGGLKVVNFNSPI